LLDKFIFNHGPFVQNDLRNPLGGEASLERGKYQLADGNLRHVGPLGWIRGRGKIGGMQQGDVNVGFLAMAYQVS
jgi:hypothetical protein